MSAFPIQSLEKDPEAKNAAPGPVDCRVTQPRRGKPAHAAGRTPLSARGTKFVRVQNSAPITEREIAADVAHALADYSIGQIAQAANCTKDTAKSWKQGKRAPRSSHLLNMAETLPRITDYVEARTGLQVSAPEPQIVNHRNVVGIIAVLQQATMFGGETAIQAKALLAEMMQGPRE